MSGGHSWSTENSAPLCQAAGTKLDKSRKQQEAYVAHMNFGTMGLPEVCTFRDLTFWIEGTTCKQENLK